MKRQRSSRGLGAARALALAGSVGVLFHAGRAHAQGDVLILGQTVSGAAASLENRIVTTPTTATVPGTTLLGLGLSADIVTTATWATPPKPYSGYKAIVLGDPSCAGAPTPVAAPVANLAAWAPAVTGNVVVIGTDYTQHWGTGGSHGPQLLRSAIAFAASGAGTGAVISLSCYYHSAAPATSVSVLGGFGTFTVTGVAAIGCGNDVRIVATSPALTGLSNTTLSGWGCSVHEWFNSWDPSFIPLAIATDITNAAPNFTAADGTRGNPYILARGNIQPVGDSTGILKVCKVAGNGVAVGTPFTFKAGSSTLTVPAGPAPGGYCVVGPVFPQGTNVTVTEAIPVGYAVASIAVAPPIRLVGTPNLAGGSVTVQIGSGVTEVTFTDERRGYLEICKRGHVTGSFTFTVNPGNLGPFVVPAGACSPPILVPAGTVVITEAPKPGVGLLGCATFPAGKLVACNPTAQTATVTVAPGDVSTQTIVIFNNGPKLTHTDTLHARPNH